MDYFQYFLGSFLSWLINSMTSSNSSDGLYGILSQIFPSLFPPPEENFLSRMLSALGVNQRAPPENPFSRILTVSGSQLFKKFIIHEALPPEPPQSNWMMIAGLLILLVLFIAAGYLYKYFKRCRPEEHPKTVINITVNVHSPNGNTTVNVRSEVIVH